MRVLERHLLPSLPSWLPRLVALGSHFPRLNLWKRSIVKLGCACLCRIASPHIRYWPPLISCIYIGTTFFVFTCRPFLIFFRRPRRLYLDEMYMWGDEVFKREKRDNKRGDKRQARDGRPVLGNGSSCPCFLPAKRSVSPCGSFRLHLSTILHLLFVSALACLAVVVRSGMSSSFVRLLSNFMRFSSSPFFFLFCSRTLVSYSRD